MVQQYFTNGLGISPILVIVDSMALTTSLLMLLPLEMLLKNPLKLTLTGFPVVEPYQMLRIERMLSWKSEMEL